MLSNLSGKSRLSIFLLIVFVGLCLWAYVVSNNIIGELNFANSTDEESVLKEVIITETKEGQKFWEVYAVSGRYNKSNDLAVLKDIKGNFYKKGEVVLSVASPIAEYDSDKKEIRLKNGAVAANNKGVFISADVIKWVGANDLVIATGNVMIERNNEVVTISDESSFDSDFTNLKLSGNSKTYVYSVK